MMLHFIMRIGGDTIGVGKSMPNPLSEPQVFMSLPRAIGYLGITLLLALATFGIFVAFTKHDWYGVFVMVGFLGILAFFWHALRAAAKREQDPALRAASGLGWYGESLSALFRGPVLHTFEGLTVVCGSVISLLYAVLAWFSPSMVALNPARASINTTLFCLWPILLFVVYVRFCGPHFRQSLYTSLVMLCAVGVPFYIAYK
mgnify:FL=1